MRRLMRIQAIGFRGRLIALVAATTIAAPASGDLLSYANGVRDTVGISKEAVAAALGPPDYVYTEGTFSRGASAVFVFPAPLDDVPGEDLILSAFIEGEASTESTIVLVEARAAETDLFTMVAKINTGDGRVGGMAVSDVVGQTRGDNPLRFFDHVHHFPIDFDGRVRKVSQVRITNLGGDELRLDALEGVHPALRSASHVVEIRIFRLRADFGKRFGLRFKNLGGLEDGVAMSGFIIRHATDPWIDATDDPIVGRNGKFEATPETTAGPSNGALTQMTEYVWNGVGQGLAPGDSASYSGWKTLDLDMGGTEFFENMTIEVIFVDGVAKTMDWDALLENGDAGLLYSLYEYPNSPVSVNGPRPTFYFEITDDGAVSEDICTSCAILGPLPSPSSDIVGPPPPAHSESENPPGNSSDGFGPPVGLCGGGLIGLMGIGLWMLTMTGRSKLR